MTANDVLPAPDDADRARHGLTVAEAAAALGVCETTVVAWQDRGRLGRVDAGGRDGVPPADVRRLAESPARAAVQAAAAAFDPDGPDVQLTDGDVAVLR